MKLNFCTLTDKNFVYKCLALFNSLQTQMPESTLWVLCLDSESEMLFKKLQKKNLRTLTVTDLGNKELKALRASRTKQEFAWTCKPSLMSHLLEKEKLETLIFADSDLLFYMPVGSLFAAHPQASVMLTSHKFSQKKAYIADIAGYFNSGFIIFRNDETSRKALRQWKEQCIEWCFNYHDKGRHGDQSYLKTWPAQFSNIEEIPEKGVNLGTWNLERYIVTDNEQNFLIDGEPLICFHFHGFIVYLNEDGTIKPYPITVHHIKIYDTYIQALQNAYSEILSVEPSWKNGFATKPSPLRLIKQKGTQIIRIVCQQIF
jgi:hypothetical protein